MSEEMTTLPGRGIRVDSSQPQQQGIAVEDHRRHNDELLEVIKGANGMPVLLVTSSDGRLSAIAMNGLQNMVPTNREKKSYDSRAWMLLIASLMATATFTAGLNPPGGFWSDDTAGTNGHFAGTSVMRSKFPRRYRYFQYSNSVTFFYSLLVIGVIAINIADNKSNTTKLHKRLSHIVAVEGVLFSILFFGISYITGTWDSNLRGNYNIFAFAFVLSCISLHCFFTWSSSRRSGEQPPDTNSS